MYVYDNDMEQTEIKFQTRIKLLLDFDMVMIIKVKLTLLSQMVQIYLEHNRFSFTCSTMRV